MKSIRWRNLKSVKLSRMHAVIQLRDWKFLEKYGIVVKLPYLAKSWILVRCYFVVVTIIYKYLWV